jgi:hypothetical protein
MKLISIFLMLIISNVVGAQSLNSNKDYLIDTSAGCQINYDSPFGVYSKRVTSIPGKDIRSFYVQCTTAYNMPIQYFYDCTNRQQSTKSEKGPWEPIGQNPTSQGILYAVCARLPSR